MGRLLMSSVIQTREIKLQWKGPVSLRRFRWIPLVYRVCVLVEAAAAPFKNKGCFYSSDRLDQIQALVWMNSMLVLLEQAADVVCP